VYLYGNSRICAIAVNSHCAVAHSGSSSPTTALEHALTVVSCCAVLCAVLCCAMQLVGFAFMLRQARRRQHI